MSLNAGSSSIKFALFELRDNALRPLASGVVETQGAARKMHVRDAAGTLTHDAQWADDDTPFHRDAMRRLLAWRQAALPDATVVAAGHRVLHGGVYYDQPVLVTDEVIARLRTLIPMGPLHQPHNISGIEAAREAWPHVIQVACFDTGFHGGREFVHNAFALPRSLFQEGIRRYGFHGLSYEYLMTRLRKIAPEQAAGRVVLAHLGNGSSMCAVKDGRAVECSTGFTGLDGLPMGTRCGQLDPAVVLYLQEEKGMSLAAVTDLLYRQSGLKGLSGISHDMRELEASGKPEAAEAIAYFVTRIRRELGGMAVSLQGLDAMVFSGGIGEHAWRVREQVLANMAWLGIELDDAANRVSAGVISSDRSRVKVLVIPTNEEAMIARHTVRTLGIGH